MLLPRVIGSTAGIGSRSSSVIPCQWAKIGSVFALQQQRFFAAPSPNDGLKKTPLEQLHIRNRAKMVPFAGYSMPALYKDQGITASHKFVRSKSGLFDVSHMVQHRLTGPGALPFLHTVTPSDLTTLQPCQSTLSVFLHPVTGGIVDDLIITMETPQDFYIVTNAACKDKDIEYISTSLKGFYAKGGDNVNHSVLHGQGLIALQGPLAKDILQKYVNCAPESGGLDLRTLYFGYATYFDIPLGPGNTERIRIARGGYTGEDGFEVSISPANTEAITQAILDIGAQGERLKLTGLGARDSLRLEAGMCLYGHDIDDTTTPIEANLRWLIGKSRATEANFNGAGIICRQYNDPKLAERCRVGFVIEDVPAREGAAIFEKGSYEVIGIITSGCPSPTLGLNIAMGYIKNGFHRTGTEVDVEIRGKVRHGKVAKMPFVVPKYYKRPGKALQA